jgi:hypothetical protein
MMFSRYCIQSFTRTQYNFSHFGAALTRTSCATIQTNSAQLRLYQKLFSAHSRGCCGPILYLQTPFADVETSVRFCRRYQTFAKGPSLRQRHQPQACTSRTYTSYLWTYCSSNLYHPARMAYLYLSMTAVAFLYICAAALQSLEDGCDTFEACK